jgi:preprotein translocase subunit SecF
VISGFTFAIIWGILVGTYSSFFIAAPVLIILGTEREGARELAKAKPARP